ncbi:MAG TPA: hypothetical protein VFV13_13795 [Acidimicrobiia bacterium]|nr:hypothetical protein [Acidimicrobiia bacterium]
MTVGERPIGRDRGRPIEEWTDDEVVAEYRHIKGELADEDPDHRHEEDAPAEIIEAEMKRRALSPDRENLIPDAAGPDRGSEPSQTSRGTAPAAGEDTPG